jgi:hypothetical protein
MHHRRPSASPSFKKHTGKALVQARLKKRAAPTEQSNLLNLAYEAHIDYVAVDIAVVGVPRSGQYQGQIGSWIAPFKFIKGCHESIGSLLVATTAQTQQESPTDDLAREIVNGVRRFMRVNLDTLPDDVTLAKGNRAKQFRSKVHFAVRIEQ